MHKVIADLLVKYLMCYVLGILTQ